MALPAALLAPPAALLAIPAALLALPAALLALPAALLALPAALLALPAALLALPAALLALPAALLALPAALLLAINRRRLAPDRAAPCRELLLAKWTALIGARAVEDVRRSWRKPRYGAVRHIEHAGNLACRFARVAAFDRLFLLVRGELGQSPHVNAARLGAVAASAHASARGHVRPIRRCGCGAPTGLYVVLVCLNRIGTVEAKADTDLCDQFIDDAVAWASKNANIKFDSDNDHPRLYLSHLIVDDDTGIANLLRKLSVVGDELSIILESYGDIKRKIEPIGFALQSDVAEKGGPVPFKVERRAGVPFSTNLYFSSAPARTIDHLRLLNRLESILRD